jgi:hypothetical protein
MILKVIQTTRKETTIEKERFYITISSKGIKLQILQDPTNSVLRQAR